MATTETARPITHSPEDLESIRLELEAGGPFAAILQWWRVIEPRWDELETVDPNAYTLDRKSWDAAVAILRSYSGPLEGGGTNGDYQVCLSMELVNRGPKRQDQEKARVGL